MRHYTIGMIARNGLLLGARGKPLHDKAGVTRRIRKLGIKVTLCSTPNGVATVVSAKDLLTANAKTI